MGTVDLADDPALGRGVAIVDSGIPIEKIASDDDFERAGGEDFRSWLRSRRDG